MLEHPFSCFVFHFYLWFTVTTQHKEMIVSSSTSNQFSAKLNTQCDVKISWCGQSAGKFSENETRLLLSPFLQISCTCSCSPPRRLRQTSACSQVWLIVVIVSDCKHCPTWLAYSGTAGKYVHNDHHLLGEGKEHHRNGFLEVDRSQQSLDSHSGGPQGQLLGPLPSSPPGTVSRCETVLIRRLLNFVVSAACANTQNSLADAILSGSLKAYAFGGIPRDCGDGYGCTSDYWGKWCRCVSWRYVLRISFSWRAIAGCLLGLQIGSMTPGQPSASSTF